MSDVHIRSALNKKENCTIDIPGGYSSFRSSKRYFNFRRMVNVVNCCLCICVWRKLRGYAVQTAYWFFNKLKRCCLIMYVLKIIGFDENNRQHNRNTKDEEYKIEKEELNRIIKDSNDRNKHLIQAYNQEKEEKENLIRRETALIQAYNHEKEEKENALGRENKLIQALNQEKQEKENALTRLSAVAGDRLRFNNPGIADLSDEYRPNKLAEKFSELYDNEWTEYYEDLERTGSKEEDIIGQLLQLMQQTFTICKQLAENQRKTLIDAIAHPGNSKSENDSPQEGILIKVIDFQKRTVPWALEDVKKKIMDKFMDLSGNKSEAKGKYIERCVQLCWMMAIQDPPMYLDFKPQKNSFIDKNVYKMFTKSGELMDFMVWPAVFLHQNGPLVQKGVVQPK